MNTKKQFICKQAIFPYILLCLPMVKDYLIKKLATMPYRVLYLYLFVSICIYLISGILFVELIKNSLIHWNKSLKKVTMINLIMLILTYRMLSRSSLAEPTSLYVNMLLVSSHIYIIFSNRENNI